MQHLPVLVVLCLVPALEVMFHFSMCLDLFETFFDNLDQFLVDLLFTQQVASLNFVLFFDVFHGRDGLFNFSEIEAII